MSTYFSNNTGKSSTDVSHNSRSSTDTPMTGGDDQSSQQQGIGNLAYVATSSFVLYVVITAFFASTCICSHRRNARRRANSRQEEANRETRRQQQKPQKEKEEILKALIIGLVTSVSEMTLLSNEECAGNKSDVLRRKKSSSPTSSKRSSAVASSIGSLCQTGVKPLGVQMENNQNSCDVLLNDTDAEADIIVEILEEGKSPVSQKDNIIVFNENNVGKEICRPSDASVSTQQQQIGLVSMRFEEEGGDGNQGDEGDGRQGICSNDGRLTESTCSICLLEYKEGDSIAWSRNPLCNHAFHEDCIVSWLIHHEECPNCRNNYFTYGASDDKKQVCSQSHHHHNTLQETMTIASEEVEDEHPFHVRENIL